jgi:beta-N-acetylhexosaminidase
MAGHMNPRTPRELHEKYPVARRFMAGFHGSSLPREMRGLLAQELGGVAIYPRNFSSVESFAALTKEIRAAAARPVLIGVDAEGGTRFSLPEPFTQWPSPAELGALGDADAVQSVARTIGRELAAVGCNLNFAPMLDLHVNPASPVTQVRSYGADPNAVGRMGAAYVRGLKEAGVFGCAKHFPGHGDAQVDPHEDLPVFHGTQERLANCELVPFRAAIAEGVRTVMTAHILLPKIDSAEPASLSRKILTGILREQMKFEGLILADDLGMGAIARRHAPSEAGILTFAAGADVAMFCHDTEICRQAMTAVARAMETNELLREEWEAAGERINRVTDAAYHGKRESLDAIGCREHRELARELRERIRKRSD